MAVVWVELYPLFHAPFCYTHFQQLRFEEVQGWRHRSRRRVTWLSTRLVRRPTEMEMQLMKAYMAKTVL